ncbi:hypothetical protein MUG87_06760 [Ectobacillus sp. JY-23]|uniref:hypothetical protein n=1 Tax=Ectobacillus sp. JY-23 TaxID=2933872 RepID=UPI001FF36F7E|nr:hypothetical protein [Ectobacillus sp. JY-23]UOY93813.1 hypothetical protein MUG87_06760 [Ectobacillus sp. JY-23]
MLEVVIFVRGEEVGAAWGSTITVRPDQQVHVKIEVCNNGRDEVNHFSLSHMLRDNMVLIPVTLHAQEGEATVLFRLIRWIVPSLQPGQCAILYFDVMVGDNNSPILTASYTYQVLNVLKGPYLAKKAAFQKDGM